MNKLSEMIADRQIDVEELAAANDLIERAKLVTEGIGAARKNILFPMGENEISCYHYTDSECEYTVWASVTNDGTFVCSGNFGEGPQPIGRCNLTSFRKVFLAFEESELFAEHLMRFLNQEIEKAKRESK